MYRAFLPAALLLIAASIAAPAQQIVYPDDESGEHWVASASVGLNSPFGTGDFAASWSGRFAAIATIEYYPASRASFGAFVSHTSLEHTGRTSRGPADCMRGLSREQTGLGLVARVHAARWNGFSLVLGGLVGATNVTRERPLMYMDGTVYGIAQMSSSIDLAFGGSFGIEATIAPGTSIAVQAGYEGVENQVDLNESIVAHTSVRVSL